MATSDEEVIEEIIEVGPPSRLPWVLLVIALAAGATASTLLLRRVEALIAERETTRVTMREEERKARARLEQEHDSVVELKARLASAERRNAELLVRGDDLERSVQAKDDELAKVRATAVELPAPAVVATPSRAKVAAAGPKKRAKAKLASAKPTSKKRASAH